jgi:hypothetical protein
MKSANISTSQNIVTGLSGLFVGLALTACNGGGGGPDSPGSVTPDIYSKAICDPLSGSAGPQDPQHGLVADLAYLADPVHTSFSSVFDFESQATQVTNPVYLTQLDVPTEYFERGFTTGNGSLITTPSGAPLVEYFSLHAESVIQLGANDQPGNYQFAVASDDGAVVSVDDGAGMRILINNDGQHPTQLGCAQESIAMDHSTRLPINVDYYQGPRYNIALILLWRKVDPQSSWCSNSDDWSDFDPSRPDSLNDPYCGQQGNNLFFNWSETGTSPSTPNSNWNKLLARGWSVVPAQDYYLPPSTEANPCNTGTQCFTDTFNQPAQTRLSSVDLLFVTDTSSDDYDRASVAQHLHGFASQLPAGADFGVGMMLGDGSSSAWHGALWHSPSVTPVLSSKNLDIKDMESLFAQDIANVPDDTQSGQGELGLYSLSTSMNGNLLAQNQSQGFFRQNAALAVVFIANDGDACSTHPSAHPECQGITPAGVLSQLQTLKAGKPLSVDAIVHTSHCSDPDKDGEDQFGEGYIDLVQLANGLLFSMSSNGQCNDNSSLYEVAMQQIGQAVSASLQKYGTLPLLNDFTLSHQGVAPSSITVSVDGSTSQYQYNANENQVDLSSAGTYGSVIGVNYCLAPSPSPSPSVTASPSPTPSVSASPSPSPTPSVSASPSPSPTPSVSASPSPSPTPSVSASPSPSPTPSVSASPDPSPSPSVSASPSPSPTPSVSASPDPSPSPSVSASPDPSPSPSPSCTGPFCGGGVLGV